MGKCIKCGTNFVGTVEESLQDTLCHWCELSNLKDALDLHRDEFKRVIALNPSSEIIGLCNRAVKSIEQTVPVVVQRDKFASIADKEIRLRSELGTKLLKLETALTKIQTHSGFDENNCAMKPYDVLCQCQQWAEEALKI